MKKIISLFLAITMTALLFCSCKSGEDKPVEKIPDEEVTLTVSGPWSDFAALETISEKFTAKYPNCTINYEFIQNYEGNHIKRLAADDYKIDLFLTNNIQFDSPSLPYALELTSHSDTLDLSQTFDGLLDNFLFQSDNPDEAGKLYSIPMGADVRGMYVNVTLLDSLGLKVPTNRDELMEACRVLSENGYIPLQGNPGMFSQQLLYPYICNIIVNTGNYEKNYNLVNSHSPEAVELFRDPMQLMYDMVEKNYYNYKYAEKELNLFLDTSNEGYARNFFNIVESDNGYEKKDDMGVIAFMPFTQSLETTMQKTKEDYHSKIEYKFILSPVGDDGGYAYLSPARGIAINKNSDNIDWSLKFLNFMFEPENNIEFADDMGVVPNTENAFELLEKEYDIPKTNICQLGQVTFIYPFYGIVCDSLMNISKANNPKYMETHEDGSVTMYPFSHYIDGFAEALSAVE